MAQILVIEDEEHIRSELTDWLHFEGYAVCEAADGQQGIKAAKAYKPDLILCDIAMPMMNGHEVLVELRSDPLLRQTPFVFLTAAAGREAMRKGMNMGADDYLTKPFTHAEVMRAVEARLQQKSLHEAEVDAQRELFDSALSEERERFLLKSRLVAMLSHDFRNALALVLSASGMLRNYGDRMSPERIGNQLDLIDGSVHLLLQMLDDMLVIAEMDEGHLSFKPELVDVAALAEKLVQEARLIHGQTHEILFRCDVAAPLWLDPKLLRHILTNLVSNAVKYSPPATIVTIELTEQRDGVHLCVADQGIGIPQDAVEHLFDPFYRAANARGAKGTGLGLTIVKQAVDLHEGKIAVTDNDGRGTRFLITFPRQTQFGGLTHEDSGH